MKNAIQIVGMGYHTPNPSDTLQRMQEEKAEVLLVLRHDPLYGPVVMCLYGTEYVGTVARFDVRRVVQRMQCDNQQTLCGHVSGIAVGENEFSVELEGELASGEPAPGTLWDEWQPDLCVTLPRTEEEMHVEEAIALLEQQLLRTTATPRNVAEVKRQNTAEKLLQKLIRLTRFDLTRETQQALRRICHTLSDESHPLHPQYSQLHRALTHLGSYERREEWAREALPALLHSAEADALLQQWCWHRASYRTSSTEIPALLERELEHVEEQLRQLPAQIYYHIRQPEMLFSLLVYTDIPRQSWRQLRTLLVLRHRLSELLPQVTHQEEGLHSLLQRTALPMPQTGTPFGTDDAPDPTLCVAEPQAPQYGSKAPTEEEAVAAQIAPCFLGDELEARKFLNHIRGMRPTGVTREVRQLVKEGKIADEDKGTHLWEPLHQNGYYPCQLANWNKRVAAYNFTT